MIALRKPVSRWVELPRGRTAVTLAGDRIEFRLYKSRARFALPLASVFVRAADAYQQQRRAERRAQRGGAR
jgi:hypothetical protein